MQKWYYCFKQHGGHWIVCGPYDTSAEADKEREKSKAWDSDVGNVFLGTKEEAEKRCETGQTG